MLADGKKWSCATCIKGHRASHCNHVDRPLIEIKKKGRPMTQCQKCRELRVVRQLHVKCNCADTTVNTIPAIKAKRKTGNELKTLKLQEQHLALRPIAPKPSQQDTLKPKIPKKCCSSNTNNDNNITAIKPVHIQLLASLPLSPSISPPITPTTSTELNGFDILDNLANKRVSAVPRPCCSSKATSQTNTTSTHPTNLSTTAKLTTDQCNSSSSSSSSPSPSPSPSPSSLPPTSVKTKPDIEPIDVPTPCCSIEKINPEGKRTRVVTCRCGDSCACPGCDAHPSRAMKTSRDPYTGFGADISARRRLSIAAICEPVVCDQPSALLESCGCGCQQVFGSCLDEMLYAIHP
ncbi:copper fist DNA binding domain-containing protein [Phycomyces blakesleeanus]